MRKLRKGESAKWLAPPKEEVVKPGPTPVKVPKVDPKKSFSFRTVKGSLQQIGFATSSFTLQEGIVIEGIEFKKGETLIADYVSSIGEFMCSIHGDELNKVLKSKFIDTLRTTYRKP